MILSFYYVNPNIYSVGSLLVIPRFPTNFHESLPIYMIYMTFSSPKVSFSVEQPKAQSFILHMERRKTRFGRAPWPWAYESNFILPWLARTARACCCSLEQQQLCICSAEQCDEHGSRDISIGSAVCFYFFMILLLSGGNFIITKCIFFQEMKNVHF